MLAALDIDIQLTNSFLGSSGQRAGFLALAGFLGGFLFIRTSARMIRSPRFEWWPGSVETAGGLHIHHLVWGIVTIMLTSFINFALVPGEPWHDILAVLFGIGCGLTLDEFALWLRLEDVYWADQGRASVDAVIIATIVGAMILAGVAPLDTGEEGESIAGIVLLVAFNLSLGLRGDREGKAVRGRGGGVHPNRRDRGRDPAGEARIALGPQALRARRAQARAGPLPRYARARFPTAALRRGGRRPDGRGAARAPTTDASFCSCAKSPRH